MATKIQTDVLYRNYLKQVERSGILCQENDVPPYGADGLSEVLSSSRALARREFAVVHEKMLTLIGHMADIERGIKLDIERIEQQHPQGQKVWHEVFQEFDRSFANIFEYAQCSLIGSLDEKVKRMDNFTICLFGKTKAGKSTTMEALTRGKGDTIGKGRQNTTLEAKEYLWGGLNVVDTPGIDSMQERQELETTAVKFADSSDLILFLMPHQIEEAEFTQFSRFYKQNKPIVILLNVKATMGEPGTPDFDDFLENASREVFAEADISGYCSRIEGFLLKALQIPKGLVPIVPVHSLSAFVSRNDPLINSSIREKLRDISHFDELENHLIREVTSYGELYRIKNPYDTLLLFSGEICEHIRSFTAVMERQKNAFKMNVIKFGDVVTRIRSHHLPKSQVSLERYFASKHLAVSGVVDELFDAAKDKAKQQEILQKFMPEQQVRQKIDEAQAEIRSNIEKEITDFFRSFENELEGIALDAAKARFGRKVGADMADVDGISDTANILTGLGVASSVVSGVVFTIVAAEFLGPIGTILGIGTANFWNPVGWTLLGLGVILSIFGASKMKKMRDKLKKAKADAVVTLSESVTNAELSIKDGLSKWVDDVLGRIEAEHIKVMDQYAQYAGKHLTEIRALTTFVESLRSEMQAAKFQSMLRRFQEDDEIYVADVTENGTTLSVHAHGSKSGRHGDLEQALSRVEEKSIDVVWRPPCRN